MRRLATCLLAEPFPGNSPPGGMLVEYSSDAGRMIQELKRQGWQQQQSLWGATYFLEESGQAVAQLGKHLVLVGDQKFVHQVAGSRESGQPGLAENVMFRKLNRTVNTDQWSLTAYMITSRALKDMQQSEIMLAKGAAKLMGMGFVADLIGEMPVVQATALGLNMNADDVEFLTAFVLESEQQAAEIIGLIDLARLFSGMMPEFDSDLDGLFEGIPGLEGFQLIDLDREGEVIAIALVMPMEVLIEFLASSEAARKG
jgi:hypothetical protein